MPWVTQLKSMWLNGYLFFQPHTVVFRLPTCLGSTWNGGTFMGSIWLKPTDAPFNPCDTAFNTDSIQTLNGSEKNCGKCNHVPHEVWNLYGLDWFEAAAAESKMCYQIFVPDLAPSILQRYRWYFANIYIYISCSRFHGMAAIFHGKKSHFCTFLPVYFGYSNETW